jgi:hypothetical protein
VWFQVADLAGRGAKIVGRKAAVDYTFQSVESA